MHKMVIGYFSMDYLHLLHCIICQLISNIFKYIFKYDFKKKPENKKVIEKEEL